MIASAEVVRSLTGVWMLFLDRRGALQMFDTTVTGFWRSFQAIVLIAPFYAFTVFVDQDLYLADPDAAPTFDATRFLVSRGLTLVVDWVTLPILLALLGGWLGIRAGYSAYVVVRNWGNVLTILPYAGVSLLELAGVMDGQLILVPALAALIVALRLSYLTVSRTLGVTMDVAIAFVLLDFLVSLGIADGIAYLFGVGG